jgi:hypothetical protein
VGRLVLGNQGGLLPLFLLALRSAAQDMGAVNQDSLWRDGDALKCTDCYAALPGTGSLPGEGREPCPEE